MPHAAGLPAELARLSTAVIRPRDVADVYANPRADLRRLARAGLLLRLATGYYARVPQHRTGDGTWRPDLHAAGLAIAQADYGIDAAALTHVSAARRLGAIPREIAWAVVAAPKQRPALDVLGGRIEFVKRDVTALDVQRIETELGPGWVTTAEQTLLDLATPRGRRLAEPDVVDEALRSLATRVDWDLVDELAGRQRKRAGAARARALVGRDRA
jgi:predicted transcriptional regulator of viral defense system